MGFCHDLHLVGHVGLQIKKMVLVASSLDNVKLLLVQEDDMTVITVCREPGELSRNLGDVVHSEVGGGHDDILAHQQSALQLVGVALAGDALDGDAVGAGGDVELFDQGFCPAAQGDVHADFPVHQHVVAADGAPARRHHRRLPAHNDTFGELFDKGDFSGIRHDVFSDLINIHIQGPCSVADPAGVQEARGADLQHSPFQGGPRAVEDVLVLLAAHCARYPGLVVLNKIHKVGGDESSLSI